MPASVAGASSGRSVANCQAAPSRTIQPPVGAAKWVPSTSTGRLDWRSRKARRVARACCGSTSKCTDQSGSQHWIGWCIRSPVITASWPPERMRTLTCPGVWPGVGSRRTSDVMTWSVSTGSARPASITGCTESTQDLALIGIVRRRPVRELDAAEQVARVRKGRQPAAIDEARVPADVVDVQVRAQHRVDRLRREARGCHLVEKRTVQLIPHRDGARLVVADAGIDDDAPAFGLDHERVHRREESAVAVREVRPQPGIPLHVGRLDAGEKERRRARALRLDDLRDRHGADPPLQHGSLAIQSTKKSGMKRVVPGVTL